MTANPPLADLVMAGAHDEEAVPVGHRIFMSRGVSNCYLVGTDAGALLVNTGMASDATRNRQRFARVSDSPIVAMVFTQSHGDHVGGWSAFDGPGVQTIVQSNFADVRGYWSRLGPFYGVRSARLWASFVPASASAATNAPRPPPPPEPVPTATFDDTYTFEVGDRRVELFAVPGGETTDSSLVRLPDDGIVFSGNLMGPMYGHVPNLYTIRGDKIRSALEFVRSVDRLRSLEPEIVITGHGDPIVGKERIAADLTKLRDAVLWVHDETVAGMNAGTDLFTLMRDITPPPELTLGQGHGKVAWNVRATWEEYTGWFRYESTTELYPVPPRAVWADLVELAGGPGVLADRAAAHVAAGRPVEALHLTDMALGVDSTDRASRTAAIAALEVLLERSGRANLSETRWLETEIATARAALGD